MGIHFMEAMFEQTVFVSTAGESPTPATKIIFCTVFPMGFDYEGGGRCTGKEQAIPNHRHEQTAVRCETLKHGLRGVAACAYKLKGLYATTYLPFASRKALRNGRPAARTFRWVASMSYSSRRRVTVCASKS